MGPYGAGLGASKMVERLSVFDMVGPERQESQESLRSIKPSIIISLLLLKDKEMHMNIVPDYEMKKC